MNIYNNPNIKTTRSESKFINIFEEILPDYEIPHDNLVGEVLIPAMSAAVDVRVGTGFFSAGSIAQIAPGLVSYINSNSDHKIQILLSPEISLAEQDAIKKGTLMPQKVLDDLVFKLFKDAELSESAIIQHTLDCLSYLIVKDLLILRFVLMKEGMYHKKLWLLNDGTNWLAVHGSGNVTTHGLFMNGESMTVDRPWMDGESSILRVDRFVKQWERHWENRNSDSITLAVSQALPFFGRHGSDSHIPTVKDFWDAWSYDNNIGLNPPLPPGILLPGLEKILVIPSDLEWKTGKFKHQGLAVDSYLSADGRGVMAIATGGGKTITSLIAASKLQDVHKTPFLVIILVPSKPLMNQWEKDVLKFHIQPLIPGKLNKNKRKAALTAIVIALDLNKPRTEVIISTNSLWLKDQNLRNILNRLSNKVKVMFIGDEMHNLGTPNMLSALPDKADWCLGLSATPVRQYDPDGTNELLKYFGETVFEFGIQEAIDSGCLAPYDYYLHEVELTYEEMDKWLELSEKLKRVGFIGLDDGQTVVSGKSINNRIENPIVADLLRKRRAILEQAGNKINQLENILIKMGPENIKNCLIYTSAKPPLLNTNKQIEIVNLVLSDLGIISHQITYKETSGSRSESYLDAFKKEGYQVITAMKVLDEGVDIPQISMAFLLASSTVRREWIQRRGRILRNTKDKSKAILHDFLIIPPDPYCKDGKTILKGEISRADEFSSSASNEWNDEGPRSIIDKWESVVWI